jgi:hypothetical protein
MSQRECAGFNWPPPGIRASEPVSISPVTVKRAGPSGLAHITAATVFRLLSLFPASLLPFCAGVPAIGVGQPDSLATSFSGRAFSPCLLLALDFQSRAAAVGQPDRLATAARSGPFERIASIIAP